MADHYVKSTGSNTSPYDTWAKAATSYATVLAAVSNGDNVWIDSAFSETIASAQTWNPGVDTRVVSTNDTTNQPPTTYSAGATVNTSGANSITSQSGAYYGTNHAAGSGGNSASLILASASSGVCGLYLEDCILKLGNTNTTSRISIGASLTGVQCLLRTKNCQTQFSNASQGMSVRLASWYDFGSQLDTGATHAAVLFVTSGNMAYIELTGTDLSNNPNIIFSGGDTAARVWKLYGCKFPSSGFTPAFTGAGAGSGEVFFYDCAAGNTQYVIAHYTYNGKTEVTTSTYLTSGGSTYDGTNPYAWVVSGNSVTSRAQPYISPPIPVYNATLSSTQPWVELLRISSATLYKDIEVYGLWTAKTTSGFPLVTFYTNRPAPTSAGSNLPAGVGTGSWTGGGGTPASMKLTPSAAFTPAVIGDITVQIAIAVNDAVYVDAKIRA